MLAQTRTSPDPYNSEVMTPAPDAVSCHVTTWQVGDEVWIGKDVSEPAGGWAAVTPCSVGTLISVNGEDVQVNFPECENWRGLLLEIELIRPIILGDKVRVR